MGAVVGSVDDFSGSGNQSRQFHRAAINTVGVFCALSSVRTRTSQGVGLSAVELRRTAEESFGRALRARRAQAGYSLRQLAPLVYVSPTLLANIEKAQRRPQPDVVERLDTVLGAQGMLQRLAAVFTASWMQPPNQIVLEPESAELVLGDVIAAVRAADHTMAAEHLDEIVTHAHAAQQILEQVAEPRRGALRRLIAESHQLIGWMLFDRGSIAAAEISFTAAQRAAEQAGATDVVAFVGGPNAGFMSTWTGDPARGAERCYASLAWARRSRNHRLTAFVSTMAARAHARMGEADLCRDMLAEADTALARHRPDTPDPAWLDVFDAAALAGHRGSCLLDLGQLRPAVDALSEQEMTSPTAFLRNRTIWQLEHAEAQLRLGDYDAVAASTEHALNGVATGSSSTTPRVLRMFQGINRKIHECGDPAVSDVGDRLAQFIASSA